MGCDANHHNKGRLLSCASRVMSGGNRDLPCAQRQAARESSLDCSTRCRTSGVLISKKIGVRCDSDVVLRSTRLVAQPDFLALRRQTSYGWCCSPNTAADLRISDGHVSRSQTLCHDDAARFEPVRWHVSPEHGSKLLTHMPLWQLPCRLRAHALKNMLRARAPALSSYLKHHFDV